MTKTPRSRIRCRGGAQLGALLFCATCQMSEGEHSGEVVKSAGELQSGDTPTGAAIVGGSQEGGYTLFEADPVRPVAVLENSDLVAVTNTVDDYLEVLRSGPHGLRRCGQVKVGMRPVAVTIVRDEERRAELWVSNHLSDSVSVVTLDPLRCSGEVTRTLQVGDEPRDIVATLNTRGESRVFVATAHRGQHHPSADARSGRDLVRSAAEKANRGLGDVFVFDPAHPEAPQAVVNLFSDKPRALAVGRGVVYAAGFHTGNRTAPVALHRVVQRGIDSLSAAVLRTAGGGFVEDGGLPVLAGKVGERRPFSGGQPAIRGKGRCLPDPRPDHLDESLLQLCVQTDDLHRPLAIIPQPAGSVDPRCQCNSGDGTPQPTTAVIVTFYDSPKDCGTNYTQFPDGTKGCWLDGAPRPPRTPAEHPEDLAPPMAWNTGDVQFSLPDEDVFAIDVDSLKVKRSYSSVGTVLFGMAVRPKTDQLFVANTDAKNLTRFEGHGKASSTTVVGHLHESRITRIDPSRSRVEPVHLNDHIDYGRCCSRLGGENEASFATPTAVAFSADGRTAAFTALGSNTVGFVQADALRSGFRNRDAQRTGALRRVSLGDDERNPAGPVGLAYDKDGQYVYVKTHFSNEVVVIDPHKGSVVQRVGLPSPEPTSVREGRHLLYNARLTSSHGDSSCASCHVFGDLDALAWDLGNPEAATIHNPGPFAVAPEIAGIQGIAVDPFGVDPRNRPRTPDFRSVKGPMTTQTLRGLANHGAMHWRGDRTRNLQDVVPQQPDVGSFNEANSFDEFDVAFEGLLGNDAAIPREDIERFTRFALQLTLPPNPVRALDNTLSADQSRGREIYFGCQSLSDDQFAVRQCDAMDGTKVNIDQASQECVCASNPVVMALKQLPLLTSFLQLMAVALSDAEDVAALFAGVFKDSGLPSEAAPGLQKMAGGVAEGAAALGAASVALVPPGLLAEAAARPASQSSGLLLSAIGLLDSGGRQAGVKLLEGIAERMVRAGLPVSAARPEMIRDALLGVFPVSNINLRVLADESTRGTTNFRDMLRGCRVDLPHQCRLRVTDALNTCHGCHTFDPRGNEEFGVSRPGFFGTAGNYTSSGNLQSQVFKIPHLRNVYQKVGMFGMPRIGLMTLTSNGGLFHPDGAFAGPQVRSFGFLHDGSFDRLHSFFGADPFSLSAINPGGFDASLPPREHLAACRAVFRAATPQQLAGVPAALANKAGLCLVDSGIPDKCFIDPEAEGCGEALKAVAARIGDSTLPERFAQEVRPFCFLLGHAIEGGTPSGQCYTQGQIEQDQLEGFIMAFDSNLRPMVGQQLTVGNAPVISAELARMVRVAQRGDCDVAVQAGGKGWLMIGPNGASAGASMLRASNGSVTRLGDLLERSRVSTLTCYPPSPTKAEARRSAFSRSP